MVMNGLASMAGNYGMQAAANMADSLFGGGQPQVYGTNQADSAYQANQRQMLQNVRQNQDRENSQYAQRVGFDQAWAKRVGDYAALQGNAAANANNARLAGLETLRSINDVYRTSGDRLAQQGQASQAALNNAAQTMAGLFR